MALGTGPKFGPKFDLEKSLKASRVKGIWIIWYICSEY